MTKRRTFDGRYEIITDDTSRGIYILLMPADGDLSEGYILERYANPRDADDAARQLTECYAYAVHAGLTLMGDTLHHASGATIPVRDTLRLHTSAHEFSYALRFLKKEPIAK